MSIIEHEQSESKYILSLKGENSYKCVCSLLEICQLDKYFKVVFSRGAENVSGSKISPERNFFSQKFPMKLPCAFTKRRRNLEPIASIFVRHL